MKVYLLAVTLLVNFIRAAEADWYFEEHADSAISNYVGSCYAVEYYYYQSFKCETLLENCLGKSSYCSTIEDPRVPPGDQTMRLLAIILPSVLGGGCLLGTIIIVCLAYFGIQAGISWKERQARQRTRAQRKNSKVSGV